MDGRWGLVSTGVTIGGQAYDAYRRASTNGMIYVRQGVSVERLEPSLEEIASGRGGFALDGESAGDGLGGAVTYLGDINGDGLVDYAVSAPNGDPASRTNAGRTYVVYGRTGTGPLALSAVAAGSGGFAIDGGSAGETSGGSIAAAGDVNGDGLADIVIGAPGYGSNAGRAYVVYGKTTGGVVTLSSLGTGGFQILGEAGTNRTGVSVSGAGDVNGDGYGDVIVGASSASNGRAYVVFGKSGSADVALSGLAGAGSGFLLQGESSTTGYSVSGAGDVNGDGLADLIVGAPGYGSNAGRAYVVFGRTASTALNLSGLSAANAGFAIVGGTADDMVGTSVSYAGDVNGDGLADLIVSAPNNDALETNAGRAYVVFGRSGVANVTVTSLGTTGFAITGDGLNDMAGTVVSYAGDINGDGLADIIVAAPNNDTGGQDAGRVYVVFGRTSAAEVKLSDIVNRSGGFVLTGDNAGDLTGAAVTAGQDLNGDGLADIIIGAPGYAGGKGRAYVILGRTDGAYGTLAIDETYGNDNDDLTDAGMSLTIMAGGGNDSIAMESASSVVYGGTGNDVFQLSAPIILGLQNAYGGSGKYGRIVGGMGIDTIDVQASSVTLDLSKMAGLAAENPQGGSRVEGIEAINLGNHANTLKLSTLEVLDLGEAGAFEANGRHQLLVSGGLTDKVQLTDGRWTRAVQTFARAGKTYDVYNNTASTATLYVEQGVSVERVDYSVLDAQRDMGLTVSGEGASNYLGFSVSSAGDLNGDGLADLIFGASGAASGAGRVYVAFGRTNGALLDASTLAAGCGGFALTGEGVGQGFGNSVAAAGDVNGDGLADIIVGAGSYNGSAGRAYVIFGRTDGAMPALSSIAAGGTGGFIVNGEATGTSFASSVAGAGDVNGDGLADIVIGAYNHTSGTGRAYVVFGKTSSAAVSASAIAGGSGGFAILAECTGQQLGISVSGAGDMNGDGLADIVVAASSYNTSVGRSYVVYGKTGTTSVVTSALGTGGFTVTGETTLNELGTVAYGGDVNGDGRSDILVAANRYGNYTGRAYVIFGRSGGNLDINLSSSSLGTMGFAIAAECAADALGRSLSYVGDVNGDGLADILVGASGNDYTGNNAGKAYLVYGKTDNATVQLSAVARGVGGFAILGDGSGSQAGYAVSAAGDVNGDGLADLVVGSYSASNGAGRGYVIFGKTGGVVRNTGVDYMGTTGAERIEDGGAPLSIVADAGNDTIVLTGNSLVYAGAGDDRIEVSSAYIAALQSGYNATSGLLPRVSGGSGVDTLVINGAGFTLDLTQIANQAGVHPLDGSRLDSIERIDITGTGNNTVRLTAADIADISGANVFQATGRHQLLIDGNAGDSVQLLDARWAQAAPYTSGGNSYNVYYNVVDAVSLYVRQGVLVTFTAIEAAESANGYGGFAVNGECAGDQAGYRAANIGDFNGDGIDDLVVGAPYNDAAGNDSGRAYVIFGRTNQSAINLSAIAAGTGGFALSEGASNAYFGRAVAAAGDVNGDGLTDFIVSSSSIGAGKAYVVFGRSDGVAPTIANILSGTGGGFVVNGECNNDSFGYTVSGAGDVNGDGLSDVIVSAHGVAAGTGRAYVVFGKTSSTAVAASAITAGSGGFAITGATGQAFSVPVSGAGDLNGDGLADLLVGGVAFNGQMGRTYVVYGKTNGSGVSIAALGTGGYTISGETTSNQLGNPTYGGDVNGDGLADVLVSAPRISSNAGRAYVIFGRTGGNFDISVSSASLGTQGYAIVSETTNDYSGFSLAYAGDMNGDGLADMIVSGNINPYAGSAGGKAFVVYGKTGSASIMLSAVAQGSGGFLIVGECADDSFASGSVSYGGDINGDGLSDLIVTAPLNDASATDAGRIYVIFGRTSGAVTNTTVDVMGDASANALADAGVARTIVGGAGDDTITLTAGSVAYGGAGNDRIEVNSAMLASLQAGFNATTGQLSRVAGGNGVDTLALTGGGMTLDLRQIANQGAVNSAGGSRLESIERIDITGSGDNILRITAADIADMSTGNAFEATGSHQLMVDGNAGDKVFLMDSRWAQRGSTYTSGGNTYVVYYNVADKVSLYVRQGVTVTYPAPIIEAGESGNGDNGFALNGECAGDNAGYRIANVGDFNGDGIDDIVVGAPYNDAAGSDAGRAYLVYGRTGSSTLNLSAIAAGNGGFAIADGIAGDFFGRGVAAAGDVNGDGLADFIVGGYNMGAGRAYVVFGRSDGVAPTAATINSGAAGFVINGESTMDNLGMTVAGAGDVNGDGLSDVIVSAHGWSSGTGRAYVIFGKTSGAAVAASAIAAGSGGFAITGSSGWNFSVPVSGAGDVNGDGLADLLVGAAVYGSSTGRTFVVYGKTSGSGIAITALGTGGFSITGETTSNELTNATFGGDVNGDGLADILLTAPVYGSGMGRAYVIFGRTGGNFDINVGSGSLGTQGYAIVAECAADYTGFGLSYAGDVNGDGLADMIVSGRTNIYGDATTGRAFVVYGKTSTSSIALSAITLGSGGFVISGECAGDMFANLSVSYGGDINGDGLADLIVSASRNDTSGTDAGRVYVIFGRTDGVVTNTTVDVMGDASANALSDGGVARTIIGGAGDDTITLTSGSVAYGGAGNDRFEIGATTLAALQAGFNATTGQLARISGGNGVDTLALTGGGSTFDLRLIGNPGGANPAGGSRIESIERIDITGSGDNVLKLTATDIIDMSGANVFEATGRHQVMVDGNAGDRVQLTDSRWARQTATYSSGGNIYDVYYNAGKAAALYVRQGVLVEYTGLEISEVAGGIGGFALNSEGYIYPATGFSVSAAGDVNGDGYGDFLVGAPNYGPINAEGRTYLVFGKSDSTAIDLSSIANGNGGFAIGGLSKDSSGWSVAALGDFNGDGLADLAVGAPSLGTTTGKTYIIFGKTGAPSIYATGPNSFQILGQCTNDRAGFSVSAAGDVNGDGLADMIVGAPLYDAPSGTDNNNGRSYVVFGTTATTDINLSAIAAGSGGFAITGETGGWTSGYAVSGAGDLNGDGLADLLVGAPGSSSQTGKAYVVYGKTSTAAVNLSALGAAGFSITGICAGDAAGNSLSYAGDVNGDGLADLIVNTPLADFGGLADMGRSYVVFGQTSGANVTLSAFASSSGFTITGETAGDQFGYSSAYAGDMNGDGLADIVVSALKSTAGGGLGKVYVVYGKTGSSVVNLSAIAAGSGGFAINTIPGLLDFGSSVSSAGDVNGDGLSDLIIGASNGVGRAFVVFGRTDMAIGGTAVDIVGDAGANSLTDGGSAKTIVAGAGNDTIALTAGSIAYGGAGDDRIEIDGTAISSLQSGFNATTGQLARISGGAGVDTLALTGAGRTLDLTLIANQAASNPAGGSRLESLEKIDITGSGNNIVRLTAADIIDLAGSNLFEATGRHQVMIDGNAGDRVQLTDGRWIRQAAMASIGGNAYSVYFNVLKAASVYVKQGVTVEYVGIEAVEAANGAGGYAMNGECSGDLAGMRLSSAGDFNGDGLDDFIVAAPSNDGSAVNAGRAYIVYGQTGGATFNLSSVAAGTGGFALSGELAGNNLGWSVSAAGDVNGDGLADIVVTAQGYTSNTGRAYVVFGRTNGSAPVLSEVVGGTGGFIVAGEGSSNYFGYSASAAGDVNGDGLADMVIGAYGANSVTGRAYVVFGKTGGGAVMASDLAAGSGGFAINGASASANFASAVAGIGDVNGDGLGDIVIGASNDNGYTGRAYVVYGKTGGGSVSVTALGTGGYAITGETTNNLLGSDVSTAGDVNGDGISDFLVSAYGNGSNTGKAYVIYGRTDAPADLNLASGIGTRGFAIAAECAADQAGYTLSYAGDINGDGLSDLLVGARYNDFSASTAGRAYVVFGKTGNTTVQLTDIARNSGGFAISGERAGDQFSFDVSNAGDVNGDGLGDLLVGAWNNATTAANAGRAYIFFGRTDGAMGGTSVDLLGDATANALGDGGTAMTIVAGAGDDVVTLSAAGSIAYGGAGNDTIHINGAMIAALSAKYGAGGNLGQLATIGGGSGVDTLTLDGASLTLDLTQVSNASASLPNGSSRITSVERVDLTGSGNNTVKLSINDVLDMSEANLFAANGRHQLMVSGDAGDAVQLAGLSSWTKSGTVDYAGGTYDAWNHNNALGTVYVLQSLTVLPV
nr:FG-GAP-like repeat-containing protein [Aureimonas altamirensis]